jgi:hypothetical protein
MLTHDKSSHGLWPAELKISQSESRIACGGQDEMSNLYRRPSIDALLAINVHWMVLYQICVFGADLKSNMAARVHNVFSLAEILKIFLSETTKPIEL